jgi:hypothetical protein
MKTWQWLLLVTGLGAVGVIAYLALRRRPAPKVAGYIPAPTDVVGPSAVAPSYQPVQTVPLSYMEPKFQPSSYAPAPGSTAQSFVPEPGPLTSFSPELQPVATIFKPPQVPQQEGPVVSGAGEPMMSGDQWDNAEPVQPFMPSLQPATFFQAAPVHVTPQPIPSPTAVQPVSAFPTMMFGKVFS